MSKYRIRVHRRHKVDQTLGVRYVDKMTITDTYYFTRRTDCITFDTLHDVKQALMENQPDAVSMKQLEYYFDDHDYSFFIETHINDQWIDVDLIDQIDYLTAL